MPPMAQKEVKEKQEKRTMIVLPERLWRAAKVRAIHEGSNLRQVMTRALEEYLKRKK